jgi:hypothetical protein
VGLETKENTMRIILSYPLPTGPRSLVLVYVDDAEHPFTLLDIPADGPLTPDADCRVVDDRIDDESQAYDIAIEHMHASERLGRPAEPQAA